MHTHTHIYSVYYTHTCMHTCSTIIIMKHLAPHYITTHTHTHMLIQPSTHNNTHIITGEDMLHTNGMYTNPSPLFNVHITHMVSNVCVCVCVSVSVCVSVRVCVRVSVCVCV